MDFKVICAIGFVLFAGVCANELHERDRMSRQQIINEEIPRVNIKVFRGPLVEKDGESFARWGFWVKQPSG